MKSKNRRASWHGLAVAGLFCFSGSVGAEMKFESERVEVSAGALAEEAAVEFHFTNTGSEKIEISSVESTCDCLSASVSSKVIEPGSKAVVSAVYRVDNLVGEVEKDLILHTTDPKRPEIALTVAVKVPALAELEPRMVKWTLGGERDVKEVVFKTVGEEAITVKEVTCTRPEYGIELVEIEKGKEYRIRITPPDTMVPLVGGLKIVTDHPHPKYARMMGFFAVERPKTGAETP